MFVAARWPCPQIHLWHPLSGRVIKRPRVPPAVSPPASFARKPLRWCEISSWHNDARSRRSARSVRRDRLHRGVARLRRCDGLPYIVVRGPPPPVPAALDLLIVMGGPMSPNDESGFPWLAAERAFIRRVVRRGSGWSASALARSSWPAPWALASTLARRERSGGSPSSPYEWMTTRSGAGFLLRPRSFTGTRRDSTFPPGAVPLARSVEGEIQAFRLGERALGLQFCWRSPRAT